MTQEQVDLEYAHMAIDRQLKDGNKQVYEDTGYDQYDQETEALDDKLSDIPNFSSEVDPYHNQTVKYQKEDEWEDVETDDF